jgi:transposase-like protein
MHAQFTATPVTEQASEGVTLTLDELARQGARQMIALALQLEVAEYIETYAHLRDEAGQRLVVRNGTAKPRTVIVGATPVTVQAPRVDDRRPGEKFTSHILPPYVRRSQRLEEALPILYLRGLSTGDFAPALAELFGEAAQGFSPTNITRFLRGWEAEYQAFRQRDLSAEEFVYVWADGVRFPVRLEEDPLCCLVLVGVRPDGSKAVIALEEGYSESEEAWLSLLRSAKRRGLVAAVLAVGDGALGFWNALERVYPETKRQRCWVHKERNVLSKLPLRLQGKAKQQLHQIMYAPDRESAREEIALFREELGEKYAKAVACLEEDQEELLTYMQFPAAHWVHLRTTNPIEAAFAPAKGRTRKTKGAGSRQAGLAMAFKLIESAQQRWRKINAPHLVPLVREGVRFPDGQREVSVHREEALVAA